MMQIRFIDRDAFIAPAFVHYEEATLAARAFRPSASWAGEPSDELAEADLSRNMIAVRFHSGQE
jgi:hypothetical protein